MKFTEQQLKTYAEPLSETEVEKCKNAIRMVRDALKESGFLDEANDIQSLVEGTYMFGTTLKARNSSRKIRLFLQGSFANNTNVKAESDVDIAIILESAFIPKYRQGILKESYNHSSSNDSFSSFKDDVERTLRLKFNNDVERKNKSIKVHGNTYRVDADTVPALRYRDYSNDYIIQETNYVGGIIIYPDEGGKIINYPEQHIENGKAKNISTKHIYKKMVRIIKKMRYNMLDAGYASADKVSSFGLESLLWNIPDYMYSRYTSYGFIFDDLIKYVQTVEISGYKEANGIKDLFPTEQTLEEYKKFIQDLDRYYEYSV